MMNLLIDGELCLFGPVGMDFFDDGFTSAQVIQVLSGVPKGSELVVRINSPGGYSDEGVAIYNALKARSGKTITRAEGLAASAASLIFCAGDDRIVRRGALVMIHDPAGFTIGTEEDHAKTMESLSATATAMTEIYAAASGRTQDQCREDMRTETWLTGKEAVTLGYATATDDLPDEEEPDDDDIMAWNYRRLYARAPERLMALSDTKGWSHHLPRRTAAIANPEETALRDANDGSQGAVTDMPADDNAAARTEALNAAASIIALCHADGFGYLAEGFVKSGATVEAAKARITEAKAITEKVTTARKTCPQIDAALAEQYIVAGRSPESAATDLLERMTAIQARQGSQNANHSAALDGAETTAVWDRAVAKVNARFERAAVSAS